MAPMIAHTMDIPEALTYTLSFMSQNNGRVPWVSVFDLHTSDDRKEEQYVLLLLLYAIV